MADPVGPLIEVDRLHVSFPLYHGSARSLRRTMADGVSGRLGLDPRRRVVVEALRDVSFRLRAGDRLGLVGGNGAGKTTLLRALAGIYEPVDGTVRVRGRLDALLDANSGMSTGMTGRENINLRCLHAGLTPQQSRAVQDDVHEFADLGNFIDMPVRTYSAGMSVRLGFALTTAINPQVLLMDEWFMAGDSAFLHKAQKRLETMVQAADILVLSTHQLNIIESWCSDVIWLDQGRIRMQGPPDEVLAAYRGGVPDTPEAA